MILIDGANIRTIYYLYLFGLEREKIITDVVTSNRNNINLLLCHSQLCGLEKLFGLTYFRSEKLLVGKKIGLEKIWIRKKIWKICWS